MGLLTPLTSIVFMCYNMCYYHAEWNFISTAFVTSTAQALSMSKCGGMCTQKESYHPVVLYNTSFLTDMHHRITYTQIPLCVFALCFFPTFSLLLIRENETLCLFASLVAVVVATCLFSVDIQRIQMGRVTAMNNEEKISICAY